MKYENMVIRLTSKQVEQLRPFYEHVLAEAKKGRPGMLVAQVGDNRFGGEKFFKVAFIPYEDARAIAVKDATT